MEHSSQDKKNLLEAPLINSYGRLNTVFVRGEGALLFDTAGKEYLDCLAGIAVVSAGHANSFIAEEVFRQMKNLVHVSNLFFNEPMARLAFKLRESAGGWGRVFFSNSGAEANEAAIKLLRKWGAPKRYKILCAEGSFHGRTLGALAATGQPAKWAGFEPLPAGFVHLPFNDLAAFEKAVDPETVAILIEPIQGERGVLPAEPEFLLGLRKLCDRHNLALAFDEVQTGMGRTGKWWAHQTYNVKPDLFTTAKALANGLPMGACIADEPFASALVPGDHATTFGGGAAVAAGALATFSYLEENDLVRSVSEKEALFRECLSAQPGIESVRGKGLMLGVVLEKSDAAPGVAASALQEGLIVNAVLPNVIRLTPPLLITGDQIRRASKILASSIVAGAASK